MTSQIIYTGYQRTLCTHIKSQSTIETDAPVDNHGKGERFSPTDLLATSLASCMLTIMGMKAEALQIDLKGMKIEVLKTMTESPRRVNAIDLTFRIPPHLKDLDRKNITILKNVSRTCPVAQSIHPDIKVNIDWESWK